MFVRVVLLAAFVLLAQAQIRVNEYSPIATPFVELSADAGFNSTGTYVVIFGPLQTVVQLIPLTNVLPSYYNVPISTITSGAITISIFPFAIGTAANSTTKNSLLDATVFTTNPTTEPQTGLAVLLLNPGQNPVNANQFGTASTESVQRCGTNATFDSTVYTVRQPSRGQPNPCPQQTPVRINEVNVPHGQGRVQFIELYTGGVGSVSVNNLVLVLYDETVYYAQQLFGQTDANGYFLIADPSIVNFYPVTVNNFLPANIMSTGSAAVAIFTGSVADFVHGQSPTTRNLVDAIVYTNSTGVVPSSLLVLLNNGQPVLNIDGQDNQGKDSLQRCANFNGNARDTSTYKNYLPTPHTINICPPLINELNFDAAEGIRDFIELYTLGTPNQDLSPFTIVLAFVNQTVYATYPLTGRTVDANGYFTIGDDVIEPSPNLPIPQGTIKSPSWVLVYYGSAPAVGSSYTTTNLQDQATYQTTSLYSLQRCPNGQGGQLDMDHFAQNLPSYWSPNPCPGKLAVLINEVRPPVFVELKNIDIPTYGGSVTVVFYNSSGLIYLVLDTSNINGNPYYVLGDGTLPPTFVDRLLTTPITLDGAIAIYSSSLSSFTVGGPVTTSKLIDAVVYQTSTTPVSNSLLQLILPAQPILNPALYNNAAISSLNRCKDGNGWARETLRFLVWYPTPHQFNPCPVFVGIPFFKINEVNEEGSQFVEIYDGGIGNQPLADLVFIVYNQSNIVTYRQDLEGYYTNAQGYFTIGSSALNPTVSFPAGTIPASGAVAIYTGADADFPIGSPVTLQRLVDAVVFRQDTDPEDSALLTLMLQLQTTIIENARGSGTSMQRCPNGQGEVRESVRYLQVPPTFNAPNLCPTPFIINEIEVVDGSLQFVELSDGGRGFWDATGLYLAIYNGNNDTISQVFNLTTKQSDSQGWILAGTSTAVSLFNNIAGTNPKSSLVFADNSLSFCSSPQAPEPNGGAVALYSQPVTVGQNVTTTALVDAVVYKCGPNSRPSVLLLTLLNPGQPAVDPYAIGTHGSSGRCPDSPPSGGNRNTSSYQTSPLSPGSVNPCPPQVTVHPFINEVFFGNAQNLEFIELVAVTTGGGNFPLDNFYVGVYNSSGILKYSINLTGFRTDANGYFVIGESLVTPSPNLVFQLDIQDNDVVTIYDSKVPPSQLVLPNGKIDVRQIEDAIIVGTGNAVTAPLLVRGFFGVLRVDPTRSASRCPDRSQFWRQGSSNSVLPVNYFYQYPTPSQPNPCWNNAQTSTVYINEWDIFNSGQVEIRGVANIILNVAVIGSDGTVQNSTTVSTFSGISSVLLPPINYARTTGAIILSTSTQTVGGSYTFAGLIDAIVYINDPTTTAVSAALQDLLLTGQKPYNLVGKAILGQAHSLQRRCDAQVPRKIQNQFVVRPTTIGANNDCLLRINEYDVTTENNARQFVELYDGGIGNQNSVVYLVVTGANPALSTTQQVNVVTDSAGYFVIGQASTGPDATISVTFPANVGYIAIYSSPYNTTNIPANRLDGVVYITTSAYASTAVALAGQVAITGPIVNEDTLSDALGDSLGRCFNGAGSASSNTQFRPASPTPGRDNNCQLMINELNADSAGTDADSEFVEFYNPSPNVYLNNYYFVFYNASSQAFRVDDLSTNAVGYFVSATGFFVEGNFTSAAVGPNNQIPIAASNWLPNGPAAVAIYAFVPGVTPVAVGDSVNTNNIVDALVYTTQDNVPNTLLLLLNPGQFAVDEGSQSHLDSIQRCPNGAGNLRDTDTYRLDPPTPGVVNTCPSPILINEVSATANGPQFVELYDKGSAATSLEGLVLVLYNNSGVIVLVQDLSPFDTNSLGYFLVGNDLTVPLPTIVIPSGILTSAGGAVAIYQGPANTYVVGSTTVFTANIVDALVYQGTGVLNGALNSLSTGASPTITPPNSLQRCPNGQGSQKDNTAFRSLPPSAGNPNRCPFSLVINEFSTSDSSNQFVELFDSGTGNLLLRNVVLVGYGPDATVNFILDLDSYSTTALGYFTACTSPSSCSVNVTAGAFAATTAGAIAIYQGTPNDFAIGQSVTNNNIIDAVVFDFNDPDQIALLQVLLNPGQPQLNQAYVNVTYSYSRCPNGQGGARNTLAFQATAKTVGAANQCNFVALINEIETHTTNNDRSFVEIYSTTPFQPLTGLNLAYYNQAAILVQQLNLGSFITDENGFFVWGNSTVVPPPDATLSTQLDGTTPGCIVLLRGTAPVNAGGLVLANIVDSACWVDQASTSGLPGVLSGVVIGNGVILGSNTDNMARCISGGFGGGSGPRVSPANWQVNQADTPSETNTCPPFPNSYYVNEFKLSTDGSSADVEFSCGNGGSAKPLTIVTFDGDSKRAIAVQPVSCIAANTLAIVGPGTPANVYDSSLQTFSSSTQASFQYNITVGSQTITSVTGIVYVPSPLGSITHVVTLYSSIGAILSTATFTNTPKNRDLLSLATFNPPVSGVATVGITTTFPAVVTFGWYEFYVSTQRVQSFTLAASPSGGVALYEGVFSVDQFAVDSGLIDALVYDTTGRDESSLAGILMGNPTDYLLPPDVVRDSSTTSLSRCPTGYLLNSNSTRLKRSTIPFLMMPASLNAENPCRPPIWFDLRGNDKTSTSANNQRGAAACYMDATTNTIVVNCYVIASFSFTDETINFGAAGTSGPILYSFSNAASTTASFSFTLVDFPQNLDGYSIVSQKRALVNGDVYLEVKSSTTTIRGNVETTNFIVTQAPSMTFQQVQITTPNLQTPPGPTRGVGSCVFPDTFYTNTIRCSVNIPGSPSATFANSGLVVGPTATSFDVTFTSFSGNFNTYNGNNPLSFIANLLYGNVRLATGVTGTNAIEGVLGGGFVNSQFGYQDGSVVVSAILRGIYEVPPTPSTSYGSAACSFVNVDFVRCFIRHNAKTIIAAQINVASFGFDGSAAVYLNLPIVPYPIRFSGAPPLVTTQSTYLYTNGGLYVNIRSGNYPTGEIRGQLLTDQTYNFNVDYECVKSAQNPCTSRKSAQPFTSGKCQLLTSVGEVFCGNMWVPDLSVPATLTFTLDGVVIFTQSIPVSSSRLTFSFFIDTLYNQDGTVSKFREDQIAGFLNNDVKASIQYANGGQTVVLAAANVALSNPPNLAASDPLGKFLGGRPLGRNSVFVKEREATGTLVQSLDQLEVQ